MTYFDVDLPSKGLPYDCDPKDIQMTFMTGEVEEIVASMSQDNYEEKSFRILQKIIKGIDVKKLTLGDRQALMIQNTINNYTKFFQIDLVCNKCLATNNDFDVDLTKVDFNEINPDGFERRKIINIGGKTGYVRLFTLGDEIKAEEYINQGGVHEYLYRLSCMVDIVSSIAGDGKEVFMDSVEKLDFLKKIAPKQYLAVKIYGEKYQHGSLMTYKFKCPCCDEEATAVIPFLFSFVQPAPSVIEQGQTLEQKELLAVNDVVDSESSSVEGKGISDIKEYERGIAKE